MSWRGRWKSMNAYDIHKMIINDYILTKRGATSLLKRDSSRDKRDIDVIRENHRFLWNEEEEEVDSWEKKLAKKYYDRLFKEYCIGDLTLYKNNKVGLRWRTEKELIDGKGQFSCGEKHCNKSEDLKTWEVNFAYAEEGVKKNALVKIRLCPKCSHKLNYRFKRKEVKRLKRKNGPSTSLTIPECNSTDEKIETTADVTKVDNTPWKQASDSNKPEEKSQDEELDEFLHDLFL